MANKLFRRRWLSASLFGLLLTLSATALFAQENTETREEKRVEGGAEPDFGLHLLNTGIFAVALGYALWKLGPKFFNARSADIQKAIKDATGLKMDADFRSSEIDRKMATLPDEVNRMREQARREMEREHQRRQAETEEAIKRIEHTVEANIEGMRAEGRAHIRRRATRAALALAERRLRERAVGPMGDADLKDFIHLVEQGAAE